MGTATGSFAASSDQFVDSRTIVGASTDRAFGGNTMHLKAVLAAHCEKLASRCSESTGKHAGDIGLSFALGNALCC